jgi:hypothetical protein
MVTARTAMATASPHRATGRPRRLPASPSGTRRSSINAWSPATRPLVSFGQLRECRQHLGQLVGGERGGLHEPVQLAESDASVQVVTASFTRPLGTRFPSVARRSHRLLHDWRRLRTAF